ncbi:hypothetical protein [Castellaniella denitrificans]|uniref:CdiI immunity protein domain-containing protein n=1 Tax=Castellaniella denitrificans TaxID=56119 RepID=A0ABT4M683_9BURK|nr:hypothetical protein [Castellaniella denitrificans]MCZ4330748.1 hypothetical protein [Castellaniella denitrificans]
MLTTTKGPGDPETWPCDPAAVIDLGGDHIRDVLAERVQFDPVGRDREQLLAAMAEEFVLDDPDCQDEAITYLARHVDDPDFPLYLRDRMKAAFSDIARTTDIRLEIEQSRRRRAAELADI